MALYEGLHTTRISTPSIKFPGKTHRIFLVELMRHQHMCGHRYIRRSALTPYVYLLLATIKKRVWWLLESSDLGKYLLSRHLIVSQNELPFEKIRLRRKSLIQSALPQDTNFRSEMSKWRRFPSSRIKESTSLKWIAPAGRLEYILRRAWASVREGGKVNLEIRACREPSSRDLRVTSFGRHLKSFFNDRHAPSTERTL